MVAFPINNGDFFSEPSSETGQIAGFFLMIKFGYTRINDKYKLDELDPKIN